MEASNKAVVDSACTSTVCGKEWFDTYMDTLTEFEKSLVTLEESDKFFKFGGGEILKSCGYAKIPCVLGEEQILLRTDVVDSHIPLLLSNTTLEEASAILDLGKRKISLYGKWFQCDKTSSGLYTIDIGKMERELPMKVYAVEKIKCARTFLYTYKESYLSLHI